MKKSFLILIFTSLSVFSFAQNNAFVDKYNVVTSAVPFVLLSPDSKAASMGDAGVASDADANSVFWNTSKLAFSENKFGASFSYAPWLRDLVSDMGLINASVYKRISENQTITFGATVFDQGKIEFTDAAGGTLGDFHSTEMMLTAGIAQKLSQNFSTSLNVKFINSNLVGGAIAAGSGSKPARTGAFDLGFYYNRNNPSDERKTDFAYGLTFQNIGGKVSYGFGDYYIPANLKIGTKISHQSGEHNNFTFLLDFNKLLVPSPQADGSIPNKSSLSALFSSFGDAPDGMKEEIKEVTTSIGAEYSYDNLLALRTGYFYESNLKGGRKYLTTGMGVNLKEIYKLDLAYLIPVKSGNPLANTWRLTLSMAIPQ